MIVVKNLTKSYGLNKGVFDLNFTVKKGEVFGFLGPNGAGKTTTIRHLLGFITPQEGEVTIDDKHCFNDASIIQKNLGYISGEIAFIDSMKGIEFLKLMAALRNLNDFTKMHELINYLELDPSGYIKKMSKGMKQKLAIVAAFMHNPEILILDEPTSGLDPLMQSKFITLIKKEKALGKTILMSSHNFEEIERTCDRALIIKHGNQVALKDIKTLKDMQRKIYLVSLKNKKDLEILTQNGLDVVNQNGLTLEIQVSGDPNHLIAYLSKCELTSLDIKQQSLEEIFMDYYKEGESNE
ncbi:ATP-binding cassette domain-containing protein [Liberiplasma polymorphum]|uniref:ABC transporter ATP-binding protein n=1 Tax=Liberiplasma polymorphum TaxID=3374570 RepID=UPI003775932F